MTQSGAWTVRFTEAAARDFIQIVQWSEERFGSAQAERYGQLLRAIARELEMGPNSPFSKPREDIGPGLRVMHADRKGRPARHFVLYRQVAEYELEIVRLLHDGMDLSRHLPPLE
jgi:toxin ParE1/3/4